MHTEGFTGAFEARGRLMSAHDSADLAPAIHQMLRMSAPAVSRPDSRVPGASDSSFAGARFGPESTAGRAVEERAAQRVTCHRKGTFQKSSSDSRYLRA